MAKEGQSDKLETLNRRLDAMVDRGMEQQRQFHGLWQDGINYVFDNQLHGKARRKGWDRIAINYIWPATIQEIALLSQQKPQIICLPGSKDESDVKAADVWEGGIQWQWDKDLGMTTKRVAALYDTKLFGYAVIKTWWEGKDKWNENNLDWDGKTSCAVIHPCYFGADPEAESPEDWEYCFTQRNVRLGWAKQRWPDKADDLDAEAMRTTGKGTDSGNTQDDFLNLKNVDTGIGEEGRITSILQSARGDYEPSGDDGKTNPDDKIITIQEIYFKDYETRKQEITEQVPVEELAQQGLAASPDGMAVINPQTNEPWTQENWPTRVKRTPEVPVYPNGRFILRVGKTILNDKESDQRWNYSHWPFTIMPNYILPHIWQGLNAVEMSRPLQNWLNVCASHLTNYLKHFGDPAWVVEEGILSKDPHGKKSRLMSGAGAIIQVIKGGLNRIMRLPPPPLSSGVMEFFNLMSQEIRNQTGMQEVVQGIQGGAKMTATESTRLNANSRLRVALQGVFQEDALRRIAEQLAEINQKNWSVGQWVRVVGANKQKGIEEITSEVKQAEFDVDIEIGTAMPFDQEKRKQDYMQAAQFIANPQYAAMLPELLNEMNIANAEEILQRVQVYQQMQQLAPIMPYMEQILQLPQVAQYMAQVQAQQQPQQGAA